MKPSKIINGPHRLKSNIPKSAIGLSSLKFSRLIAGKYAIFLRSDSLPALIFRRLSGVKNASNSSHSGPFNNYINLQSFSNSINQLKITLKLFNNHVTSTYNIHAYAKVQTSVRYYNPPYIYPKTNRYHYTIFTAGKTDFKSGNQNRFIKKQSPKKPHLNISGKEKSNLYRYFISLFHIQEIA